MDLRIIWDANNAAWIIFDKGRLLAILVVDPHADMDTVLSNLADRRMAAAPRPQDSVIAEENFNDKT